MMVKQSMPNLADKHTVQRRAVCTGILLFQMLYMTTCSKLSWLETFEEIEVQLTLDSFTSMLQFCITNYFGIKTHFTQPNYCYCFVFFMDTQFCVQFQLWMQWVCCKRHKSRSTEGGAQLSRRCTEVSKEKMAKYVLVCNWSKFCDLDQRYSLLFMVS